MGVLSYQLSVLHNTTIAQLLLCTAEVQERAVPEPSLHLRLLLQPQWCVLTRIHFEQGLCCCSTAGAGLPGFSSPALIGGGRARAGNVSTSLFCKNLRSPGLAPAGPSRAEFEICYFMSEYPQQPEHCQSCFFSVFHFF